MTDAFKVANREKTKGTSRRAYFSCRWTGFRYYENIIRDGEMDVIIHVTEV